MPHDQPYLLAEKKIQTMIEELQDTLDWNPTNHGNPPIKKIMVKTTKGGKYDA